MRNLFGIVLLFFIQSIVSQEQNTEQLYKEAIDAHSAFEREDNDTSMMYIYFVDERFSDVNLANEKIELKTLSKQELNSISKRGIDYIEVYPFYLSGNKIIVEIISLFRKRRKITSYGKSTYSFSYDCKDGKYILTDMKQSML